MVEIGKWLDCTFTPFSIINNVATPTLTEIWSNANLDECNWNSKVLHALFIAMPPEEFRRASMCEVTKEV